MIKELIEKTDILSEAEKAAAEYIVKNAYDCLYLSAEELGKKTFTSGSTITRVSKN